MKERKEKQKVKLNQKEISMLVIFGILALLMSATVVFECILLVKKSRLGNIDELRVARTYSTVKTGDDSTESEKVKFDAYVAKDLDGDGYAEKLRGTCKKIGESDTLYMQLNIESGGTFKNGRITINGENFYLSTGLVAGDVIKENYFNVNTETIALNDITEATNTLITGNIQSGNYNYDSLKTIAINRNNINNLSSENNEVILTGTFVDESGEEISIEKKVKITVDWYGSLDLVLYNNYQSNVFDEDNSTVKFTIDLEETKKELVLSNLYIEGEIPQIEGYDPEEVILPTGGTYDETTRKFVIKLESQVDEEGNVIKALTSRNTINVECRYPREAFISQSLEDKYVDVSLKSYVEGYNNEKISEKIIRSNEIDSQLVLKYTKLPEDAVYTMGLYMGAENSINTGKDYLKISKKNATKAFINSGIIDNEFETYSSIWQWERIKNNENDRIILYQKYPDTIDREDVEGVIINTGIKLDGYIENLLGSDGYINIYNADNDELIKHFEKEDFHKIYEYNDSSIKRIRLETSPTVSDASEKQLGGIKVINYKKIDNLAFSRDVQGDEYDEKLEKLLSYKYIYTSYYYGDSFRENSAKLIDYTSDMDLTCSNNMFSSQISNNAVINLTAKNEVWKDGKFLIKLPNELTKLDINSISTQYGMVSISKYKIFKKNDNTFLEIETKNQNQYDQEFSISIDANLEFDPLTTSGTYKIEAYGVNPNYELYALDKRVDDIYNLSDTSNYVSYSTLDINVVAPNSLVTSEKLLDQSGNILARPSEQIAIDKDGLGGTRKISISVSNNYSSGTLKDIFIVGKVPFTGNKYQISNDDMKSQFTATMTNDGITIPNELVGLVKVYYSENEIVTKDLNNISNNWTETPSDFTKVKSYMIDLSRVNLDYKKGYNFTYDIKLPDDSEYNKATYSSHAVYFGLNTNEGILNQEIETNKMGIVVAKKMNLELTKYEELSSNTVSNSTYKLYDANNNSNIQTTNEEGKISVEGLYIEKEYILKEINENKDYEKDNQEIRFVTYMENGELKLRILNGILRSSESGILPNNIGFVKLAVNARPKYTLSINKFEKNTTNSLSNVKFKFVGDNGESVIVTGSNGNVTLSRLLQDYEYTLKEIDAPGFKAIDEIKFKVTKNEEQNDYVLNITSGSVRQDSNISKQDGKIPQLTLNIENERLNTYTFELSKVEKDNNDNFISNTKFNLKGKWLVDSGIELTTDSQGILRVDLYDGVEYTLEEIEAADGYILNNSKIRFKANRDLSGNWTFDVIEGAFKSDAEIDNQTGKIKVKLENEKIFTIIKKDEETGELLKGVKFAIYEVNKHDDGTETLSDAYDVDGNVVGVEETINGITYRVLETDERGTISKFLRKGLYKAIEVQALEGYKSPEINENTYYFGIGEYLQGDYTTQLVSEREDIVELDIEKTLDGGYVGVHGKTITKYDSNFNVVWSNSTQTGNSFTKVVQTNDGGYVAVARYLLAKYSSNGEVEWTKQVENNALNYSDVIFTSDGNILVGIIMSYGDKPNDYIQNDGNLFSIRKFDLSGNQIWKNDVVGDSSDSYGASRNVDINLLEVEDESYITCLNRYDNLSPALLYKFDKNGNQIWSTVIGEINHSGYDEWLCLYSGCVSEDGGYIWVGTTSGYAQYEVYGIESPNIESAYYGKASTGVIVKLNSNGEIVWMKENVDTNLFLGIQKLNNNTYIVQGEDSMYVYDKNFRQIGKYTLDKSMFAKYTTNRFYAVMTDGNADQYSKFITLDGDKILIAGNYSLSGYKNNKMTILQLTKGDAVIPEAQKIVVYNSLKEYNIITHAGENGTISGGNDQFYEKVQHGKDATKDIIVTPNLGYVVGKITINGEMYSFNEDRNGVVTLPKFKNVKEDKIVLASFVPKANLGYVDVEFRDVDTNEELLPKQEIRGTVGEKYQADPQINVAGYSLVTDRLPSNRNGIISNDRITVVYYYKKIPVKITTKYLDVNTRETIADDVVDYKYPNEEYHTKELDNLPDEYILDSSTNNTSGVVTGKETGNEITVEYYYKIKEFSIKTRTGTKGGTITGSDQNVYETVKYGMNSTKDIVVTANENWYIDTIFVNGEQIGFTEDENRSYRLDQFTNVKEDIEVVANFKCKNAIVTVSYLDNSTNESIADDEVIELNVGEKYETFAKDIEGYELVEEPENKTGIMGSEDINVVYYYQKLPIKVPEIPSTPETPLTGSNLIILIVAIIISTVTILLTNIKLKRGETNAK